MSKQFRIYPTNCVVCGTNKNPTQHHIIPKQYNEMSGLPTITTCLCKNCHVIVEKYYLHFNPLLSRKVGTLQPFYEKHIDKPKVKTEHLDRMKMRFSDYYKKEQNTNVFGFYYLVCDIIIDCVKEIINNRT